MTIDRPGQRTTAPVVGSLIRGSSHRDDSPAAGAVTLVGLRGSGLPQGVDWIDPERAASGPDAGKQTRGEHDRR